MAKTIVGLFDTFADAQTVVDDLIHAGFDRNDISMVSRNQATSLNTAHAIDTPETDTSSTAEAAGGRAIGGTRVTVSTLDAMADQVYALMRRDGAVDIDTTAGGSHKEGGNRFDATADPHDFRDTTSSTQEQRNDRSITDFSYLPATSESAPVIAKQQAAEHTTSDVSPDSPEPALSGDTEYGDSLVDNWKESSKIGTVGGTLVGAVTGAAMGAVGGPVGVVIGGITGAASGGGLGAVTDAEAEAIEDETSRRDNEIDTRSPTYQSAAANAHTPRNEPHAKSDSSHQGDQENA